MKSTLQTKNDENKCRNTYYVTLNTLIIRTKNDTQKRSSFEQVPSLKTEETSDSKTFLDFYGPCTISDLLIKHLLTEKYPGKNFSLVIISKPFFVKLLYVVVEFSTN